MSKLQFKSNRDLRQFMPLVFALLSMLLLSGCVTYKINEPKRGITDQLLKVQSDAKSSSPYASRPSKYDWSKLKGEYGLYVFSYKIKGKSGSNFTGSGFKTKEGIRIWEHKFSEKEGDSICPDVTFSAWEKTQHSSYINLTNSAMITIHPIYKKGRVVYGGLVDIAANEGLIDVITTFPPDSLWEQFLTINKDNLVGIPIDSIVINTAN